MELNGIANLLAVLEMAKWDNAVDKQVYLDLLIEIDNLERYMVAYHKANLAGKKAPFWHEVRDNKAKYKNSRG